MPQKKSNKPVLVAIFAHPDDEAYGPSGTLYKYSKTHDIYIICATKGENGGEGEDLGQQRAQELKKSAKIIGAKEVYFLGFIDGTLSNSLYHHLAEKIEKILKILKPQIIVTFEPRGVSGHIDHIVVSMVTTFVVEKLTFIEKLYYFCLSQEKRNMFGSYFIYFPPGYKKSEIAKIVDVTDVWDLKVKAMMVHKSQITDGKRVLNAISRAKKEEHFLIFKRLPKLPK